MNPALMLLMRAKAAAGAGQIAYVGNSGPVCGPSSTLDLAYPANSGAGDLILVNTASRQAAEAVTATDFSLAAAIGNVSRAVALTGVLTGTPAGTIPLVKAGTANSFCAVATRFTKTSGTWGIAGYTAVDVDATTDGLSLTFTAPDVRAGDFLIIGTANGTYGGTLDATAATMTGITLGDLIECGYMTTAAGNDTSGTVYACPVTAGTGSGDLTFTATQRKTHSVAATLTRLRLT